jgi:Flp pilus assembly protein TadG
MRQPDLPILTCLASPNLLKQPSEAEKSRLGEVKLEKVCGVCRKRRRGAAVVEFAFVAPVFILLIVGMLEFGRMVMVKQILTNAAREGARKAVLDGTTTSDVVSTVTSYMNDAQITVTSADIVISPSNPASAAYGDPVSVTVSLDFSRVSWLPASMLAQFLPTGKTDITLTATTVMRRETVQQ